MWNRASFPSLHHRKEGWLRGRIRSREATLFRADGVVFLFVLNRKTTPASRSAEASRSLFNRSATPPCGDARRGICSIPHSFTPSKTRSHWESTMKKRICALVIAVGFFIGASLWVGTAQSQGGQRGVPGTENGIATFQTQCMSCHGNPKVERAPSPAAIRELTPEKIYESLTTGSMKEQGDKLNDTDKRGVAEFMGGRPLGSSRAGDAKNMPNQCRSNPALSDPDRGPQW